MPRSTDGKPIAARDYNWSDGFSPGQIIVTLVPGLDLKRSGAAPVTDIGRSLKRKQPIVVIDAKTGKRQLIWSELNMVGEEPAQADAAWSTRASAGARGTATSSRCATSSARNGRTIKAPRAFRIYRDGLPAASRASTGAGPTWSDIFERLAQGRRAAPRGCTWPGTSRSRAARG